MVSLLQAWGDWLTTPFPDDSCPCSQALSAWPQGGSDPGSAPLRHEPAEVSLRLRVGHPPAEVLAFPEGLLQPLSAPHPGSSPTVLGCYQ